MLEERLRQVEDRIDRAAARAGRRRGDITLIAITKMFPATAIREAYELGMRHFGENYVQEFEGKAPEVADLDGAIFHFVGHLQSNKARKAAELFQVIQTIDSEKIARRINDVNEIKEVMLEVKLSAEDAKSGAQPETVSALAEAVRACSNLKLIGLMTMPPWSDDAERSRPYFQRLRLLAEKLGLKSLSMGMSHDLEVAVQEGATHLRIGTALFGPRRRA